MILIEVGSLYLLRKRELDMRRYSMATTDLGLENNLTSVLDELPDGIIIANKDNL